MNKILNKYRLRFRLKQEVIKLRCILDIATNTHLKGIVT